jgi:hypothetical protein
MSISDLTKKDYLVPYSVRCPKCEIFDRLDFRDFSMRGDVGFKFFFIFRGSLGAAKFFTRMLSLILLRRIFFSMGREQNFRQAFETISLCQ